LLRADGALPRRSLGPIRVGVAADDLTTLNRAQVTGVGVDPATVTVAVRREQDRGWRRLGVDASPPYRVFFDPRRYRNGESLHVVGVALSTAGEVSVSPVVKVVVHR
jgi:hypothetical protein